MEQGAEEKEQKSKRAKEQKSKRLGVTRLGRAALAWSASSRQSRLDPEGAHR